MADNFPDTQVLRVADLSQRNQTAFRIAPDKPILDRIAHGLAISGIRKLVFEGHISADGKTDWQLRAKLGATVVQPCVVTLEPVVTRIDQPVNRRFVAGLTLDEAEEEVEMPEDDTQEALGAEIDLMRVLTEALALALPDYPRSENAQLDQATFAGPDVTPMTDAETKPFAGLAGLKDKLENPD